MRRHFMIYRGMPSFLPQLDQAKPTIIYFWGSWCGYCRYTSPAINSLSEEGYPVVSVALRSGSNKDVEDYFTNAITISLQQ